MLDFTTRRYSAADVTQLEQLRTQNLTTPVTTAPTGRGYKHLVRTLLRLELAMMPDPEPSDTTLTTAELQGALLMRQPELEAAGMRVITLAAPPTVDQERRRMARLLQDLRRNGARELRELLKHPAFRVRSEPCVVHANAVACHCLPRFTRQVHRATAKALKTRDRFLMAFLFLECRQHKRHFYDFVVERKATAHENGDRRVLRDDDLIDVRKVRWSMGRNAKGQFEAQDTLTVERVARSGRASLLDVDLQGWDRPTSMPTKTTRLAFCGACASHSHNPWWRVRRSKTKDGYERAPFKLRHTCPRCDQVETTPRPAGKPPRLEVKQRLGHRVKVTVYERIKGRWYERTLQYGTLINGQVTLDRPSLGGGAVPTMLQQRLEQRFRRQQQDRQR